MKFNKIKKKLKKYLAIFFVVIKINLILYKTNIIELSKNLNKKFKN